MKCIVTELLEELNNSNLPILDTQITIVADNGFNFGSVSAGDKIVINKDETSGGATVIGLMKTKGWVEHLEGTWPNVSAHYVTSDWPWEYTFTENHSSGFLCVDAGTATLSYHIVRAEE